MQSKNLTFFLEFLPQTPLNTFFSAEILNQRQDFIENKQKRSSFLGFLLFFIINWEKGGLLAASFFLAHDRILLSFTLLFHSPFQSVSWPLSDLFLVFKYHTEDDVWVHLKLNTDVYVEKLISKKGFFLEAI